MDCFRGSGAIGAGLDIGILLSKRSDMDERVRTLEAESRYDETPAKQFVHLGDVTFEVVENPRKEQHVKQRESVLAAFGADAYTVLELLDRVTVDGERIENGALRQRLKELQAAGKIEQHGKRGRAALYRLSPAGNAA